MVLNLALGKVLTGGLVCLAASLFMLWRTHRALRQARDREEVLLTQRQLDLFCAARKDSLTGLPSRAIFLDNLTTHLAQGLTCSLLLIDIDGFDRINYNYGDAAGNEVLRCVAERLRGIAGRVDQVSRLHADTFAAIFQSPEDMRGLAELVLRATRKLADPYPVAGTLIEAPASIGIACAPQHGQTADSLMRAAHLALREARGQGGAKWRICSTKVATRLRQDDQFRQELASAIKQGQIVPYYQPIVRLADGLVDKFEVLARWRHPTAGLLEPPAFIPLADELDLAGQISMSLLRQVALDSQFWPPHYRFAINVSAGQVREMIGFVVNQPGDWQRRMDLTRLDVEITENALLVHRDQSRALIEALHERGARAGLDNFGNGYSNLFHLKGLHFDTIKISRVFVQALADDPNAMACVSAILKLGADLGIEMIAEAVETPQTESLLRAMGCPYAQGFLYELPLPADAVPLAVQRLEERQRVAA